MVIELKVPSMVCEVCVATVTKAINTHEPQAKVDVDLDNKKVTIETEASEESIKTIITAAGHTVG